MKRFVYSIIFASLIIMFANSINPDENFIINLVKRYEQYNLNYRSEHVFVHIDKKLYKPGERIWFKGYVSAENKNGVSVLSKDLLIILLDNFGKQLIWERYPIVNHMANGCLVIPKSAEGGKYTVIAFTSWMKNMDVEHVYSQDIIINESSDKELLVELKYINNMNSQDNVISAELHVLTKNQQPVVGARYSYTINESDKVILKGKGETDNEGKSVIDFNLPEDMASKLPNINVYVKYKGHNESITRFIPGIGNEIEIKFYPEGGSIIKGMENKVAFKATDNFGSPYDFEGGLYNGRDELIKEIKSTENGRGIFSFIPESDGYKIKITRPYIIHREFYLPDVKDSGISLKYKGVVNDNIILDAVSANSEDTEQTYWIAENNNKICWGANIKIKDIREVKIPVVNFSTGVVRITVFNENELPVAERLVYVNKAKINDIEVKTNKLKYSAREKVILTFSATAIDNDPETLNLSVSIINKSSIINTYNSASLADHGSSANELTRQSLKLTGKYCLASSPEDIDLLMMTSDSMGVCYSDITSTTIFNRSPYYIQDGFSGFLLDKDGNTVSNAKIKLIHAHDMEQYETTSNEDGIFNILFNDDIVDFNFLSLAVSDERGRQNLQVLADNAFYDQVFDYFRINEDEWDFQKTLDLITYGDPQLVYTGKYNKPNQDQLVFNNEKKYDARRYSSYSSVMDIIHEIKPYTVINNQIVFPGGTNSLLFQQGALIVIDGSKAGTDISVLKTLSPSDIENINISTNVVDIHAYTGLNAQGIIEITTIGGKSKMQQKDNLPDNNIKEEYSRDCNFYSPDYAMNESIEEDTRTTIFWDPEVTVNTGDETVVSFYTSDIKGTYIGIVEGMSSTGIPVFAEFNYVVE